MTLSNKLIDTLERCALTLLENTSIDDRVINFCSGTLDECSHLLNVRFYEVTHFSSVGFDNY